jgi:hypothetical protein
MRIGWRAIQLYLGCAEHVYRVPVEDLKPLYRMADNPHVNAQRLQALLADVVRANPWLQKTGEMYFAWWCAAATSSYRYRVCRVFAARQRANVPTPMPCRRDNIAALLEDMRMHPKSDEELSRVLFVRPASALGHMRHHPDSQSIASVVGLSINVVELPPQLQVYPMDQSLGLTPRLLLPARPFCQCSDQELTQPICVQDDDVMDALAQLSMSRGPGSIKSRSMHSFGSSDVIVPSDTFLDNASLQTYGTANTQLVMTTGAGREGASQNSIIDLGEVFVLLDREGGYVASIRVTAVAETAAGAGVRVMQQPPAYGPIVVGYGLALTQEVRNATH